jgi:hypothetical protein
MSPPNEESLVRGVIEESSEPDTAAPTPPWKIRTVGLVGVFILLLFVIPDVVLPCVGLSTYFSAETWDLEKEFAFRPLIVIVLNVWVCFFPALTAFLCLTYDHTWYAMHKMKRRFVCTALLFAWVLTYVVWMIVLVTSREFSEVGPVWSLDEYIGFVETMRVGQVQVIIEGATHACRTNPVVIAGVSSTDASVFPNVSSLLDIHPVATLRTVAKIHWDAESVNLLNESAEVIKLCRLDPFESVNVTQTDTVVGRMERVLITKDGELPMEIRRGSAIAAGIFGFETYYFFNVEAIPLLRATIVKKNARIHTPGTSCKDLDWRCA